MNNNVRLPAPPYFAVWYYSISDCILLECRKSSGWVKNQWRQVNFRLWVSEKLIGKWNFAKLFFFTLTLANALFHLCIQHWF
jgi:hypothetical protein